MRRKWHAASEATSQLSVPPVIITVIFVVIELRVTESDEVGVLMGTARKINLGSRATRHSRQPRGYHVIRLNVRLKDEFPSLSLFLIAEVLHDRIRYF